MTLKKADMLDITLDFIEKYYYLFLGGILLIAAFNIFYNLGRIPIYSWDEARHGVSAYEMLKRGDYIVNTYGYKYDYWNLKPPISYWAIIAGYKLSGLNALGLRLFSAVAAFITIAIVSFISAQKLGRLASLIAASSLTTTAPFILEHCARSGDADSIYVMFFTLAMTSAVFIEKNVGYLYAAGVAFSLAFLTKSWHAVNILLIGGIYLTVTGTLFKLKLRQYIIFTSASVMPIVLWGIKRYSRDLFSFFKTMVEFDLLARTSKCLEGHIGGYAYYTEIIMNGYFEWFCAIAACFAVYIFLIINKSYKPHRNFMIIMFLWIIVPFAVYTKAKTKISWYILPLYPALSICLGAFTSIVLRSRVRSRLIQVLVLILIFVAQYNNEFIIKNGILYPSGDSTQKMMAKKELKNYKGKNIYSLYKTNSWDDPNRWDQSYMLCSELFADLIPIEGNMEEFLHDASENPLLLAPKKIDVYKTIKEYGLRIIVEGRDSIILTK